MPRVYNVKKARKDHGNCRRCGEPILKGEGYIYWEFQTGGPVKRCQKCPYPKPSELTQNEKLQLIRSAQEDLEGATIETKEDLETYLNDAASQVAEAAEMYQEARDNMEEAFPGGCPVMEECEEKADHYQSIADELESFGYNVEPEDEWLEVNEGADAEDYLEYLQEQLNEAADLIEEM